MNLDAWRRAQRVKQLLSGEAGAPLSTWPPPQPLSEEGLGMPPPAFDPTADNDSVAWAAEAVPPTVQLAPVPQPSPQGWAHQPHLQQQPPPFWQPPPQQVDVAQQQQQQQQQLAALRSENASKDAHHAAALAQARSDHIRELQRTRAQLLERDGSNRDSVHGGAAHRPAAPPVVSAALAGPSARQGLSEVEELEATEAALASERHSTEVLRLAIAVLREEEEAYSDEEEEEGMVATLHNDLRLQAEQQQAEAQRRMDAQLAETTRAFQWRLVETKCSMADNFAESYRWQRVALAVVWSSWSNQHRQASSLARRAVGTFRAGRLGHSLRDWKTIAHVQRRRRNLSWRVVRRMAAGALAVVLRAWKCAHDDSRHRHTRLRRAVVRFQNQLQAAGFHGWCYVTRQTLKLRLVILRLQRRHVAAAFDGWHERSRHICWLRQAQRRLIISRAWQRHCACFQGWAASSHHRQAVNHRGLQLLRRLLARTGRAILWAWRRRTVHSRRVCTTLERLHFREAYASIAWCVSYWHVLACTAARHRAHVLRTHKQLCVCGALAAAFATWRYYYLPPLVRARTQQLNAARKHMRYTAARTLRGWREACARGARWQVSAAAAERQLVRRRERRLLARALAALRLQRAASIGARDGVRGLRERCLLKLANRVRRNHFTALFHAWREVWCEASDGAAVTAAEHAQWWYRRTFAAWRRHVVMVERGAERFELQERRLRRSRCAAVLRGWRQYGVEKHRDVCRRLVRVAQARHSFSSDCFSHSLVV